MRWKYHINIKRYLSERDDRKAVRVAAKGTLRELKKIKPHFINSLRQDFDLETMIDDFEDIRDCEHATCADFNDVLESLYDWADSNRVWLGI